QQVLRLGRAGSALETRAVENVSDLDAPVRRFNSHQGLKPQRAPGRLINDRVEERICASRAASQIVVKGPFVRERLVEQVLPAGCGAGPMSLLPQRRAVPVRIERFEANESAGEHSL